MNATETTRIEIDDRIRERPDLLSAVTRATQFLTEQAVSVPPPATIRWRYADLEGQALQVSLADEGETAAVQVRYWTRWILDPQNQRTCILEVWSDFLKQRFDQQFARINTQLAELEQEEANGVQVAQ